MTNEEAAEAVEQSLEPSQIEKLAIEMFTKVRGDQTLGWRGDVGIDVIFLPDKATADEWGTRLTVQMLVWQKRAEGETAIRDIKEQEVALVPPEADDSLLAAYFEGTALGIRRLIEQGTAEVDTFMPHDFFPTRALKNGKCVSVEDFARAVTERPTTDAEKYLPPEDLEGTKAIATNAELEKAIDDDPDRVENYLVYADWLTEHGDPRGELITFSRPDAPPLAKRRAARLLANNEKYFAGNLRECVPDDVLGGVFLKWNLGYISEAWIGSEYELEGHLPDFVKRTLKGLLGLPSSRFLRALTLGCFDFEGENDYAHLFPIMIEGGARPTLRRLFIGDTNAEQQEISWTYAHEMKMLNGLYPNLEELKVRAGPIDIEGTMTHYPKLKSLTLESGGLAKSNLIELTKAAKSLSGLEHLELWTGSTYYGGDSTIEDLAPLLQSSMFPRLTRLGIRNCGYADDVVRTLADEESSHSLLERVTELDFSLGTLADEGALRLIAVAPKMKSLTKLDVHACYLSDGVLEDLKKALSATNANVSIHAHSQRSAESEEDRYVVVSE